MPVWWVAEPYINLRLEDEPVGYQPARGPKVTFHLSYRQRGVVIEEPDIFGVSPNWSCSFRAYLIKLPAGLMRLHRGGAGVIDYYTNGVPQFRDGSVLSMTDGGLSYQIEYSNGARELYQNQRSFTNGNTLVAFFLTAQIDPSGNTNFFNYSTNQSIVQLTSVTDADGNTTHLYYENTTFTNLITRVVDPFSRTAVIHYDASGMLSNIVDAVGLTTSFIYDPANPVWITNMTTPYGQTGFRYGGVDVHNTDGSFVGGNQINRFVEITLPDGGKELDLYRQDCSGFMSATYSPVPNTGPLANTLDNVDQYSRNSFHWGPLQYDSLSATYLGSGGDVSTLTSDDYANGRLYHWLSLPGISTPACFLSLERAPSPDGVASGQITWYDYDGKTTGNSSLGTNGQLSLTALVLPDGSTRFTANSRDLPHDQVVKKISTYSPSYAAAVLYRTNSYVYAANGVDMLQAIGPDGVINGAYAYDGRHRPLFFTNALGEVTSYTYNANEQVTSVTRPSGLVTTNIYGVDGFVSQRIDIGFATNQYSYLNDLELIHTDPRGLTTSNIWDNLSRLTSTVYPDHTTVSNVYNRLDLTRMKDRLGNWTYFSYDPMRRNIAATNANGAVTLYSYCTCGALESVQDAGNNVTTFAHDNQGNVTGIFYPDGYAVTNTYNSIRQLVLRADSSGLRVTNGHNNQGLLVVSSNNVGRMLALSYDVDDLVTNNIDANNVGMAMTYDNLHRLRTRSYPDGGIESYGYTAGVSGLTSYTNQVGNVVLYGYDPMDRKTGEIYVGVTTNLFAYDGASDLLTLTDGNGDTTIWTYDVFGLVSNKVDAANNLLFSYRYDADNRLTNCWSAAKGSTLYSYDAVGNLTKVDYPVSPDITLKYDTLNRLTNMVDAVGATVYGYDAAGQLLSEDGPWSDDTVSYTYQNRLRTGMSVLAPNASAWAQNYGYDAARRLTSVSSPAGEFDYVYNSQQSTRISQLHLPGGANITNSFDNVARLTSTWLKNSGGTDLDSYVYTYNQANQRIQVTRAAGDYVNYTYDNMGELKTALGEESDGVTPRWQEQYGYAYDGAGNLATRTNNTLVQQFNVNNLNELSSINSTGALTVAGTTTSPATGVTVNSSVAALYADVTFASTNQPWTDGANTYTAIATDTYGRWDTNSLTVNLSSSNNYSYDLNGNLLTDGTRTFDYDDENQLVRVSVTNVWKTEFAYDGKMRRRITKEFTWNGGWVQTNEVRYTYDGNVVVQGRDANNLPAVTYTRGNDLSGKLQGAGGIGGLLARTENSAILNSPSSIFASAFYHADGNGNVTCLIYTNQTIAAKYLYDPFGNILSVYGSLADANTYRFSSEEWNRNLELYCYLYRFYEPNLQKWLNRDLIAEYGGKNLYRFVKNNPISYVDIYGLMEWGLPFEMIFPDSAGGNTTSCTLTSVTKEYSFTDGKGNPSPGYNPYKIACKYSCSFGGDEIPIHFSETVYLDDPCSHCPSGGSVAKNPPPHAPIVPQPKR